MTISEYKKLQKNDTLMISLDVSEEKTNRVINRILEVDNFQNMACCCDDFADFVTEILEWGVDHIAGVDFFDTYKSFRDFTFNPELDIERLDTFISEEG